MQAVEFWRTKKLIYPEPVFCVRRQRSLQYTTVGQSRAHFFRHVNGRPHTGQVLVGRSCFFTPLGIPQNVRGQRVGSRALGCSGLAVAEVLAYEHRHQHRHVE